MRKRFFFCYCLSDFSPCWACFISTFDVVNSLLPFLTRLHLVVSHQVVLFFFLSITYQPISSVSLSFTETYSNQDIKNKSSKNELKYIVLITILILKNRRRKLYLHLLSPSAFNIGVGMYGENEGNCSVSGGVKLVADVAIDKAECFLDSCEQWPSVCSLASMIYFFLEWLSNEFVFFTFFY